MLCLTEGETTWTSHDDQLLNDDMLPVEDCIDRLRLYRSEETALGVPALGVLAGVAAAALAAAAAACFCCCNSWCLALHAEYTSATLWTTSSTKLCHHIHVNPLTADPVKASHFAILVKPTILIFDIRLLWHSGLSARISKINK